VFSMIINSKQRSLETALTDLLLWKRVYCEVRTEFVNVFRLMLGRVNKPVFASVRVLAPTLTASEIRKW
jgi:hypothetical protein